MAKQQMAIIGSGMAASSLLDDLLSRDALDQYAITVYSEEAGGCYNRILLSRVLAGDDPASVEMKPLDWYRRSGVQFVPERVERLDTAIRRIHVASGTSEAYDVAILATGSKPLVPRIEAFAKPDGKPKDGVICYRTLDDCLRMRAKARAAGKAIVLGGGLLGLEAAKTLCDRGLHVTVVHLAATLMETQLDRVAGEMLRRQIERCGVFVRTGCTVSSVVGDTSVEAVRLDNGDVLPADLLVLACGIRPRTEVASGSGVPVNRGVVVNDTLATSVPGVYAVGECAEHSGRVYGIVAPIWDQTRVLADILTASNPGARYRGSKLYTRLKVAGIEVASMGVIEPQLETDDVVQVMEDRRDAYRKLIIREGRLIGAVLVGNTEAAATLVQLFDRGDVLPENPLELLCCSSSCTGASLGSRTICNCNHVSEEQILSAISKGARSLEALAKCTRAGTGCGSCRGELARLVSKHAPAHGTRVCAL